MKHGRSEITECSSIDRINCSGAGSVWKAIIVDNPGAFLVLGIDSEFLRCKRDRKRQHQSQHYNLHLSFLLFSNRSIVLDEEDLSGLWSNNATLEAIIISAKTTENATTAAVVVYVWGSGS